jgi:hypothetical protein
MRMKLNYAPQAGLRRRRPDHHRERLAFWAGIAIVALFELVLMAKTWPASGDIRWPWSEASASFDTSNAEPASAPPAQTD